MTTSIDSRSAPTPEQRTSPAPRPRRPTLPLLIWGGLALIALALSAAATRIGTTPLLELWLIVFVLLVGFGAASLGLLMIGHLLGDIWLDPVRDELEPASWTIPLSAILFVPLALELGELYPWVATRDPAFPLARAVWLTPAFFLARTALYLVAWCILAVVIARWGARRRVSAMGLVVLAATFSLAAIDWVLSRDPQWWSSLGGFSIAVNQLLGALAAAILFTVARQGHPDDDPLASLESALLTLALLALWVWFAQYLVVWMANLPEEARWIERRTDWEGALLSLGHLGALVLAVILLVPSRARRSRILIACVLILVHHVGYIVWLIDPGHLNGLDPSGLLLLGGVLLVFALWFWIALEWHRAFVGEPSRSRSAAR